MIVDLPEKTESFHLHYSSGQNRWNATLRVFGNSGIFHGYSAFGGPIEEAVSMVLSLFAEGKTIGQINQDRREVYAASAPKPINRDLDDIELDF